MRGMLWQSDIEMCGQLDRDALLPLEVLPREVLDLLAERFVEELHGIRELVPLSSLEWSNLDIDRVPCSVRTRNAIKNAIHRTQLRRDYPPSLQELMDVHSLSAKGVLDFLCSVEMPLDPARPLPMAPRRKQTKVVRHVETLNATDLNQLRARLAELEREPWLALIRSDDPRFADLLPGVDGTLGEFLAQLRSDEGAMQTVGQAVDRLTPELVARVRAIESKTLDGQMLELLMKAGRVDEARATLIATHLQWDGSQPGRTLEETGGLMSVTRERVRQLRDRALLAIPAGPAYLPALDAALALITARLPLPVPELAEALLREGITSVPWSMEALSKVARDFHRPVTFGVTGPVGNRMVVAASLAEIHDDAARHIKRSLRHLGPTRIEDVWRMLPNVISERIDLAGFAHLLQTLPEYRIHDEGWCWKRGVLASGLKKPIRQMLAVAISLPAASLWAGLERHARFSRSRRRVGVGEYVELAPLPVIIAYLRECDQVTVNVDEIVQWNGPPLDDVFGSSDGRIVELVRESPDGLADREDLIAAWAKEGRNRMTLVTLLSYAPYLQRVRRGAWGLRGCTQLPELEGQGYTRRGSHTGPVDQRFETAPGHWVVSITVPVASEWEAMELPPELVDSWDGTLYMLEIPSYGVEYALHVMAIGPTPGMAALLERLGARPDEVLQLRVDTERRRGMAEVMSRADYDARVGDG